QGRFQRLDVTRAAHRAARKNLDEISAGIPGGHNLCWRQRARHNRNVLVTTTSDRLEVERGTYNKFCPDVDAGPGYFRIEHSACTDNRVVTETLCKLFDHLHRAGNCHRDLEQRDTAGANRLDNLNGFVGGRGADNRNDADVADALQDFGFVHD